MIRTNSSEEITEAELTALAHEMVAAGNLNMLYGVEPFMKARHDFATALAKFSAQVNKARPMEQPSTVQIETNIPKIPDFILKAY
jgi:hypothetical protein